MGAAERGEANSLEIQASLLQPPVCPQQWRGQRRARQPAALRSKGSPGPPHIRAQLVRAGGRHRCLPSSCQGDFCSTQRKVSDVIDSASFQEVSLCLEIHLVRLIKPPLSV